MAAWDSQNTHVMRCIAQIQYIAHGELSLRTHSSLHVGLSPSLSGFADVNPVECNGLRVL